MTTHELLESAQLDALGLLDETEREQFEAAFAAAPPDIQAQVRREQSRLVNTDWVPCPDVQPPPGLKDAVLADIAVASIRDRVLGAVHNEIVRVGRPVEHAVPQTGAVHPAGRTAPGLRRTRRVSPMWRAAALGFASASIALAGFAFHMRNIVTGFTFSSQNQAFLGTASQVLGNAVGDVLLDPQTERFAMTVPPGSESKASGSVFANPAKNSVTLTHFGLTARPGYEFRVVALDDEGRVLSQIGVLEVSDGRLTSQTLKADLTSLPRIAVVLAQSGAGLNEGTTVLSTDQLRFG